MNITTDSLRFNCDTSQENCTACKLRYTGELCETDVLDDPVVMSIVLICQIVSHGSSLFFLCWTVYAFVMRIVKLGYEAVSLIHGCAVVVILSLLSRIALDIDIFSIYMLYDSPEMTYIFGSCYMVFVLTSSMLSLSVWLNVVSSLKKLTIKQNLQGSYLASVIVSLISCALFFALLLFAIVTDLWTIAVYLQILVMIIIYLGFVITIIYYLPIFREASDNIVGSSQKKLQQVNKIVLRFLILFIVILLVIIYEFIISGLIPTNDPSFIYIYLTQELISRIFITPSIYILILLLLFGWITDLHASQQSNSKHSKTATMVSAVQ